MRKNEGGEKRDEARKGGGSKNRKGVGRGGDGGGGKGWMDGCVWAWCQSQDGGTFGQGIGGKQKQMVCEPFIRHW